MKKFRFQLDTLLELRKRKEEKIKLHLAEKKQAGHGGTKRGKQNP